ncbi:MAG: exosome complex RNA-binding protein Rrp4 [Candidatus Thermoplasmatota archaeon]|nr:exosome complex RNA-binding protein Rrp4 [Candidatus Thermoplasmatota archaeon]
MSEGKREIVIPSQLLGNVNDRKAGSGTFVEGGKIYSEILGMLNDNSKYINVIPIRGRYMPMEKDFVIGVVEDALSSAWLVDINAPYPALLHVNEVPWRVDFGETEKYLNQGDCIMAKVLQVDQEKKLQITLNDRGLYKIRGGQIMDVEPPKVPRLIGKNGSMISLLKKYTKCRIFVGQNGRVWLDGDEEGVATTIKTIRKIEEEALLYGLTNRIEESLKEESKDVD